MTYEAARQLVLGLDPPVEAGPAVSDPAELVQPTAVLGNAAVAWGVELARRGFGLVFRAATETERVQIPALELRRAIEQSTLDLLRILAGEQLPYELNRHQLAVVREMVRQDVPFERIVRGVRRVQQDWRAAFLDLIERHPHAAGRAGLLCRVVDVLSSFSDANVDAVITEYLFERQRLMAQWLTDRREMVSSIVAGEHVATDLAHRTLGTRLDQYHVAFVGWLGESRSPGAHAELERVAARAAENLHCPSLVTVPKDDATVWAWASRPQKFAADYPKAFNFVHDDPHPVRVAIGVPAPGLAGFRRSHLAARDAHRITTSADPGVPTSGPQAAGALTATGSVGTQLGETPTAPITAYRDVGLAALLSADIERARWFVSEELGELTADDPATAELRLTLLRYLDSGGSLVRTAASLHRHRNTVVHRLRKIEQLLGHPISERTQHTHAALTLTARVGPLVLASPTPRA